MVLAGCGEPRDRLIVALDVDAGADALRLVDLLDGVASFYKVGYQLFLAEGMKIVRDLVARGKRVFLDLKMHDVDETITQAVREIRRHGTHFLTIYGNGATARAAIAGRSGADLPKILSLTLLSSLDEKDLRDLHILGKGKQFRSLDDYVMWRAKQAIEAGCDGLIASGSVVSKLRAELGEAPIIVTPGIRPTGISSDDHKRFTTPRQAIEAGADYLVVGRPIRNASAPDEMARAIVREIEQGLAAAQVR